MKRPLGAESSFRELVGVILDRPKSHKMELKFNQKSSVYLEVSAPIWIYISGCLEASGGRLGLDLGVIWGSVLGSRARHATFAKNSTAPQREHDF